MTLNELKEKCAGCTKCGLCEGRTNVVFGYGKEDADIMLIANMVKCRPPKNRDPKPEEQEICIEWLREQFKVVRPKIIVCVGRISAQKLISPDFRVTKEHGMFIEKNGVLFMGTFHPAAILRNPNNKEAAFGDWLALREKIKELNINI